LDLSVNKPAKDFVRAKFRESDLEQLDDDILYRHEDVDMRMSTMKPITAQWMVDLHGYVSSQSSIVVNGFRAAGL